METVTRFQAFELDFAAYELRKAGVRVELGRREMDLLILLVRNRGCLVARTEIGQVVRGDKQPADLNASINTVIRRLRNALGDESSEPVFIQTVAGKGYRFVPEGSGNAIPATNTLVSHGASQTAPQFRILKTIPRPAIPRVAIALAGVMLAAALTFDVYGLAIALFIVLAFLLAAVNPNGAVLTDILHFPARVVVTSADAPSSSRSCAA